MNLKDFNLWKETYSKNMNSAINKNKPLLIDSLVEYYGDEYRSIIEKRFDEIIFIYFINGRTINNIASDRLSVEYVKMTTEILNKLGFGVDELDASFKEGFINKNNKFYPPLLKDIDNPKINKTILKLIFGSTMLFSTDKKNNGILSFEGMDENSTLTSKQKELLNLVYHVTSLNSLIIKKINEDIDYIKEKLGELSLFEKQSKEYTELIHLSQYFKSENNDKNTIHNFANKLFKREMSEEPFYLEMLVGESDDLILKLPNIEEHFLSLFLLSCNPASEGCVLKNDKNLRLIYLPVYLTNDVALINMINHVITMGDALFSDITKSKITDDTKEEPFLTKRGLSLSNGDVHLEEVINNNCSYDIFKIFKRKGGCIFDSDFIKSMDAIYVDGGYNDNLKLIEPFYSAFKNELIATRMADNKNAVVEVCGKENFKNLCLVFSENNGFTEIEKCQQVEKIVNEMISYRNEHLSLSKDDYYKHLEEVRADGFTVTPIEENVDSLKR